MEALTIFIDNNSSFTDISNDVERFDVDDATYTLTDTDDYLYIGFDKNFQQIYREFSTSNTNANTESGTFWNGVSWVSLSGLKDETKGSTRSGFTSWDLDQENWTESEVNSVTKKWVRFKPSVTQTEVVCKGINFLFSNDDDLKEKHRNIYSYLAVDTDVNVNDTSFVVTHQAARKKIIQELRNKGNRKYNNSNSEYTNLSHWDILEPGELREAAAFFALHLIFFEASDAVDDKYASLSLSYKSMYENAVDLFFLSLDKDDDGKKDANENMDLQFTRVVRL